MGGAAVAVVQGQVALGGTGAENPEHGVYEAAVVLGRPASGWALLAEPFWQQTLNSVTLSRACH